MKVATWQHKAAMPGHTQRAVQGAERGRTKEAPGAQLTLASFQKTKYASGAETLQNKKENDSCTCAASHLKKCVTF